MVGYQVFNLHKLLNI